MLLHSARCEPVRNGAATRYQWCLLRLLARCLRRHFGGARWLGLPFVDVAVGVGRCEGREFVDDMGERFPGVDFHGGRRPK